ncbi:hypothetical protein GQ44DRAFT_628572 [Phaeosphaeriaceae sp. PMI808]|nr:hypothetical protein GQ44DRAFT_628572 [Phaeosphaeriaceae sp. PMI808]
MSRSLSKQEARQTQVQQSSQRARDIETQEHHSSASASVHLPFFLLKMNPNILNIFGALSGAFSSKSKKTTQHNADGSKTIIEDKHDQAMANAAVRGQGMAYARGNAEDHSLKAKERVMGQEARQGKKIEGKKKVDHLGLGV